MGLSVSDVLNALESWTPSGMAQSWDNVGLQVGRPEKEVTSVLVALDLTPAIINEAREKGANLIITHHPLFFKPLKKLISHDLVSSMALTLAESGIALGAIHTNLDAARDGVSFRLAHDLGLTNVEFLTSLEGSLVKMVVFVPLEASDAVRDAIFAAGAGQIGRYSDCSFSHGGTGTFKPGQDTSPHIGQASGPRESVNEVRLEVEVSRWALPRVLRAMRETHPYEEVAHDIIPLENRIKAAGLGAIGTLPSAVPLSDFLDVVSTALSNPALRFAGDETAMIQRVAVCGGSGSDFIGVAMQAGADAYVTADVTYHRFFDVMKADGSFSMALINAGHYETERNTEDLLCHWLSARFPDISILRTAHRSGPERTWVSRRG